MRQPPRYCAYLFAKGGSHTARPLSWLSRFLLPRVLLDFSDPVPELPDRLLQLVQTFAQRCEQLVCAAVRDLFSAWEEWCGLVFENAALLQFGSGGV